MDYKISKALFCVHDDTKAKKSHLIYLRDNTFEIPTKNYNEFLKNFTNDNRIEKCKQWMILKAYINRIVAGETVSDAADNLIGSRRSLSKWKDLFVEKDMFNCDIGKGLLFSNTIYFSNNDYLLLSKRSVRSYSMSLMTMDLYYEMLKNGVKLHSFE